MEFSESVAAKAQNFAKVNFGAGKKTEKWSKTEGVDAFFRIEGGEKTFSK